MPNFERILVSGQMEVKPLWNRFSPTKPVNHKKYLLTNNGLASAPKARDNMIKAPATILTIRSVFIFATPR